MNKGEIRKKLLNKRKNVTPRLVEEKSKRIHRRLVKTREFRQAKTIMFYLAKDNEVSTAASIHLALKMKKKVCVPCTNKQKKTIRSISIENCKDDLCAGNYGILEPRRKGKRRISPKKTVYNHSSKAVPRSGIDLIIVPGTAFDLARNRLGRGLAYYDRFLAKAAKSTTIGLAFDFQIVPRLPNQGHDVPMDRIITERRII